jgi:3-oxoadipate enol-lactonase
LQFSRLNDVTLHYQMIGSPEARPLLVFVNSLGTDFRIWRDVIVRLAGDFAILTYDMRGHGLSGVGTTPYRMEDLADDLAALLEHVEAPPAIIVGLSVGGMVAQQLYARRPDLVRALVLCNTAAKMGDPAMWATRIAAIEADGIGSIADGVMERWFAAHFRERETEALAGYRNMLLRQPADGYIATLAALRDADLTRAAQLIAVPTICIAGDSDASITPAAVAALAKSIPGARFETIRNCGHIPCVEQPATLAEIMRAFIAFAGTETVSHVSH